MTTTLKGQTPHPQCVLYSLCVHYGNIYVSLVRVYTLPGLPECCSSSITRVDPSYLTREREPPALPHAPSRQPTDHPNQLCHIHQECLTPQESPKGSPRREGHRVSSCSGRNFEPSAHSPPTSVCHLQWSLVVTG